MMDHRTQGTFLGAIVILGMIGLTQLVIFALQTTNKASQHSQRGPEVVTPVLDNAQAPAPPSAETDPARITPVSDPVEKIRSHDMITTETFRESTPLLIETLLNQARELRYEGQHVNALLRLREARLIDPRHPLVLAEIAATYERMDDPDQARVFWQELAELGESAGVLLELAQHRLGLRRSSSRPAQPGDRFSTAAAALQADLGDEESAINQDAVIRFRDIREERNEAPEGDVFITLRLEVEGREDVQVLPRSVYVLVLFYEILNDKDVVPTSARVAHHWVSLPADWAGEDRVEILEVDYHLDPAALNQEEPVSEEALAGRRSYHGYIARLYYENILQDFSADPVLLLNQFPPSTALPVE